MAKKEMELSVKPEDERILVAKDHQDLPEHMRADAGEGTDTLSKYIRPPRLKIVQGNSDQKFLEVADPGSVILSPTMQLVAEVTQPFWFVPVLFFPEWYTSNPMSMKGQLPFIRERSTDPASDIARKAQDPILRGADDCPESKGNKLKHVEALNFIVLILRNEALMGQPAIMSFSKSAHKDGSQLSALIRSRRGPLYGMIFEACVPQMKRSNTQGQWHYMQVGNPSAPGAPHPMVMNVEEYQALKALHHKYLADLEASRIITDYEDEEGNGTVPSEAAASM
jgi:hypothetical protein